MGYPGQPGGYETRLAGMSMGGAPTVGDLIEMSPGLVAHYRFDETSGSTSHDYLHGHDGTVTGTPTFVGSNVPDPGAITLPSSAFITTTGTINLATGGVEIWFRLSALPTGSNLGLICGFYDSAAKHDKCLYVDSSGFLHWLVNDGTAKTITSTFALVTGRMYQAAGLADGTHSTLVIDGVQNGQVAAGNTISTYSSSGNFYIGGGTADTFVSQAGTYDEGAIFSTPPTVAAVNQRWQTGLLNITQTNARVTQVAVEVARDASTRQARVTQVAVEVARDASTRNARVTQYAVEVLRSSGSAFDVSASSGLTLHAATSETDSVAGMFDVSATSGLVFTATASESDAPGHIVSATSGLVFTAGSAGADGHNISASAASGLLLTAGSDGVDVDESGAHTFGVTASSEFRLGATTQNIRTWNVAAQSGLTLGVDIDIHDTSAVVSAVSGIVFTDTASDTDVRVIAIAAASGVRFQPTASEVADFARGATTGLLVTPEAGSGREISVSATTAMRFSGGENSPTHLLSALATDTVQLTASAGAAIGTTTAASGVLFSTLASASITLPDGGDVPGGDSGTGLRTLLLSDVSGTFPMSYAETPGGLILIADGVDPMLRWDPMRAQAGTAGVIPPSTPIAFAGMNIGTIVGRRVAFCRFVDRDGNVSNLSPVSNEVDLGRDALIDGVSLQANGSALIQSEAHGLTNGEAIVLCGMAGMETLNGSWAVFYVDADSFFLWNAYTSSIVRTSGVYQGGGSWTWGVQSVVYQNIPVPTESKVVRRQLLRNLHGDASTMYVDIDTTDLTSNVLMSSLDDETLSSNEAVPLFEDDDDLPLANRYAVPPSHKSVVASHLGRIFATADVTVTDGSIFVAYQSEFVQGYGTAWKVNFAGRMLYVDGASVPYEIAAVDEANQVITLACPYGDATNIFATYAIRSAVGERRLVYFSEPSLPEAWPPWNAFGLDEDGDEITGLMVMNSYLYILERRNIYKLSFQENPATGFAYLSSSRGSLNNRTWVQVESKAYMLDETGIHAFDGGDSAPISTPIQNLFQLDGTTGLQVDWTADQSLWHAAHDPVRDTVRWFVTMVGTDGPYHAICYDYRLNRWWLEQYPTQVTSSTVGTIGYRRSLVGTESRRVLCLAEGTLDGVDPANAARGTATAATATGITDSSASFPANLAGAPVTIVDGTGRGQTGIIADNTSNSWDVVLPFATEPDTTSVYQIGGVPWTWRSGWFRYADDESSNPRDVEVVFQPLQDPATLDVQLYFDHASTPEPWGFTQERDGVEITEGDPMVSVDLTKPNGFASFKNAGHRETYAEGRRFVSAMLSGVQATELVRVYEVNLNGVR